MTIKSMPSVGFTTRSGRKIYGQDDYRRDYNRIMSVTAVIVIAALAVAMGTL